MLKPHDIAIALKLLESKADAAAPTFASLASSMRVSASEAHASVGRGLDAGLLRKPLASAARTMPLPVASALAEFLVHGMRYVWPVTKGPITRGVATGASVPEVSHLLHVAAPAVPLVWPHPEGTMRGESVEPLYPRAVEAVTNDSFLHEWLALIDIVRMTTGRESALACAAIERRLA